MFLACRNCFGLLRIKNMSFSVAYIVIFEVRNDAFRLSDTINYLKNDFLFFK